MSRPGAWTNVWRLMISSITRKPKKEFVAEDKFGNKYYVIMEGKHAKSRGYEPPSNVSPVEPSKEWISWLKGTRRFPPSEKELAMNRIREQAQLERNNVLEKSIPHVDSTSNINSKENTSFPKYKDFEVVPGYNPNKK